MIMVERVKTNMDNQMVFHAFGGCWLQIRSEIYCWLVMEVYFDIAIMDLAIISL